MGRERQKRKNRSSISKVRQKTKSKKTVLSNPIIARAWNKGQTISQNFKRMGLAVKLNKQTGGVEKKGSDLLAVETATPDTLQIRGASGIKSIGLGEAKVERDESGRIVRVLQGDSIAPTPNPLHDSLTDLDSESDTEDPAVRLLHDQHGTVGGSGHSGTSHSVTNVVRDLEEQARLPAARYKRKQTENEQAFVESLVRKYGDDYSKMARDTKLNYMQRSEGDLKRRIKKWRQNGTVT